MANLAKAIREDLMQLNKPKFSHRNGENEKPTELNNYYWIRGEALARHGGYPWTKGERIQLNDDSIGHNNAPFFIDSCGIDMGNDNYLPLEWVTKNAEFYGPVIYTPPWLQS